MILKYSQSMMDRLLSLRAIRSSHSLVALYKLAKLVLPSKFADGKRKTHAATNAIDPNIISSLRVELLLFPVFNYCYY